MERTFIILKPDCIQNGFVKDVVKLLKDPGWKCVYYKTLKTTRKIMLEHYIEHKDKYFYNDLVDYITGKTVIIMVWEGKDIIKRSRKLITGTIRKIYAESVRKNVIHGSDSKESAEREINLWIK